MDSTANIKRWVATSVRALANEPTAYYRGADLYVDKQPYVINAPHLQLLSEEGQYSSLRGIADGIALRLVLSDQNIYEHYRPESVIGGLVYDLLEQIRIEAQPDKLLGVEANVKKRFLIWVEQINGNGLTETELSLMIFTIIVVVWSRLNSYALPEVIQENIESTRMNLVRQLGESLRLLRKHRFDQKEFAKVSLNVVDIILQNIISDDDAEDHFQQMEIKQSLNLLFFPNDVGQEASIMTSLDHYTALNPSEASREYTIFTKEFDRIDRISDIVRPVQLKELRERLDELIKKYAISHVRIAHYAKKLFHYRQSNAWLFAQELGSIDPKQLPHMIADPDYHYLYRQQMVLPEDDNIVSILIDNSGSMNNHISVLAVIVDLLVRGFEVAKIKTEVLGYTTVKWSGGDAYKKWKAGGSPKNPGRLNDLNHYIYKSAQEKWQHSRHALAGMFKTDLFRESLDGEGLLWAAERLRNYQASRKTLLVISDGSPMDTSTKKANDQPILDSHLLKVASDIEQQKDITLCALGVGLDMSAYFAHSYAVAMDQPLNTQIMTDIIDLLAHKKQF